MPLGVVSMNRTIDFFKYLYSYLAAEDQSISVVDAGAEVLLQGRLRRGIIFKVIGRRLRRALSVRT